MAECGTRGRPMDIAIPLFDRITALDAIGPYEVLSRRPGARIRWVAVTPGSYKTDNRQLTLVAEEPLSAVPHPEIIMVPGGFGTRSLMTPNPLLDWLRTAHETSQWTTSVCTGSLLLGAAGILKGLEATTHWAALDTLAELGAKPTRAAIDQRAAQAGAAPVTFLVGHAAQRAHVALRGGAGHDPLGHGGRQRAAAGAHELRLVAATHVQAGAEERADVAREQDEARHVAERQQHDRHDDRPPGDGAREVAELHLEELGHHALAGRQRHGD